MRVIKFRAERMESADVVYGCYYHSMGRHFITGYPSAIEVKPETLSQFIGLTDEKGLELYENDIIKKYGCYDGDDEHTLEAKIVFDCGGFCLQKISGSPKSEVGTLLSLPSMKNGKLREVWKSLD